VSLKVKITKENFFIEHTTWQFNMVNNVKQTKATFHPFGPENFKEEEEGKEEWKEEGEEEDNSPLLGATSKVALTNLSPAPPSLAAREKRFYWHPILSKLYLQAGLPSPTAFPPPLIIHRVRGHLGEPCPKLRLC
jgi:hypothetical protein